MQNLILIVEDDPSLVELLRYNLEKDDFDVTIATDGESGEIAVLERDFDAVIVDWMMPGISGIQLVRQIREMNQKRSIPIIMLTARGEEEDKVTGLNTGADDYMVKPFSPRELIARLRALLRRTSSDQGTGLLRYEDLEVDTSTHKVRRNGVPIHLSPKEFRLLLTLIEKPGKVFSREHLLNLVWGHNVYVEDRTVDVHIRRLRQALDIGGETGIIRTVRGSGYALDINPA